MKKHFYSYIVEFRELDNELNSLSVSLEEKEHLLGIVENNLHLLIIDAMLSELSEENKKNFLKHITSNNHNKTLIFLTENIKDFENIIKEVSKKHFAEIIKDIQEIKK